MRRARVPRIIVTEQEGRLECPTLCVTMCLNLVYRSENEFALLGKLASAGADVFALREPDQRAHLDRIIRRIAYDHTGQSLD